MSWTLCTSGAAIAKAGANVNSTIAASTATLAEWSDEVEGQIVGLTRRDWVDSYSSVDGGVQAELKDLSSDLVAMKMIHYDMSGYTSRGEAETMLNVLNDNAMRILAGLKDFKSDDIKAV